ncbi:MAG: hypothetical protein U5K37_08060 [Natrialbaceae archaeon]|nr:hypothetical protein [Natrialbaceae archaeon]
MTLGDRGRIPFAMIGVLLLVSAVTVGVTLESRQRAIPENDVAEAVDRTEAAAQTAVRTAVMRAAERAGDQPLTTRSSTPIARSFDGADPFLEYLAFLIYQELRPALATSDQRVDGVTTRLSLEPRQPTEWSDRLTIQADRPGLEPGVLEVIVPNVTMTIRRDEEGARGTSDRHLDGGGDADCRASRVSLGVRTAT